MCHRLVYAMSNLYHQTQWYHKNCFDFLKLPNDSSMVYLLCAQLKRAKDERKSSAQSLKNTLRGQS